MDDSNHEGQVWPPAPETTHEEVADDVLTGEPAVLDPIGITVHKCAACDGKHENIVMTEYTRQPHPFTHWYACPTLHDPVPVALAMMRNGMAMELNGPACQALAAAQVAGRFLVAIFHHGVGPDGKLHMYVKQHKFPTGEYFEHDDEKGNKFKGVIGMLKEALEQEAGTVQQQAMRHAAIPKPLREIFGAAGPSNKQEFKIPPQAAAAMQEAMKQPPQ
jgi:hypothetical protein